ncbi:MAG: flagellin FliC [Magnetococcales bacterium]|nr:flagellin FliC [Magnetococcales bacterium]
MSISINTNLTSLFASTSLQRTGNALGKSMQRLASGLRINNAGDDPAGLAVANRMMTQIRGLNIVKQNANEGISLTEVASAALEETTNAIQNIRDLALEAKSYSKSNADRTALQLTVSELLTEIQRIATGTKYNSINLLTGSFANRSFQIGANPGDVIKFTVNTASLVGLALKGAGGGLSMAVSATTAAAGISVASRTILLADSALDSVTSLRATLSGAQSRFESIINNISVLSDAYTSAHAGIMDTDIAKESANLARASIIQQAGIAVLAQANQQSQQWLKLLG